MKPESKLLLILLFLSPAMGELLSGSAPPGQFFNPIMLFTFILLYGCGTVLIREARVRWNLQWSVLFLAVAYGIIEEGLLVKSYFNPGWVDMGVLSEYGMYLGVQWVWTIQLTLYHATMSTLIPIAIVDLAWPRYRDVPLLKKRGLVLASAGLVFITLIGMVFIGTMVEGTMVPFHPHPLLLIGGFLVVAALIWLARRYRDSRIVTSKPTLKRPLWFGVGGFLFMLLNLIIPAILAEAGTREAVTIGVQLVFIALVLRLVATQLYHVDRIQRHVVALITGAVLPLILLTPVHELVQGLNPDPAGGMILVGVAALVLLVGWRRRVLSEIGIL